MEVIRTVSGMSAWSKRARRGGARVGFVPTMGFLHDGHLSLVREARARSDLVVLSIFVNPTQFGPGEDLGRYPRDFERDRALCEKERVDVLFHPDAGDMYLPDASTHVEESRLSAGLCGLRRPGHFRGVATVVAKLFNIVGPDVAVFGQKDAQQAAVVRRMIRDLNFPVEIVVVPTAREPDGLAMSSRNKYLSAAERAAARGLNVALGEAEALFRSGERSAAVLRELVLMRLRGNPLLLPEYVETVDGETFEQTDNAANGTVIALAVRCGATRLIDNVILQDAG
jgi:pantoate--beta-alanine ligase